MNAMEVRDLLKLSAFRIKSFYILFFGVFNPHAFFQILHSYFLYNYATRRLSFLCPFTIPHHPFSCSMSFWEGVLLPTRALFQKKDSHSRTPLHIVHLIGVSEKSGTALTKAMAAIVSSIPEALSIMPLEIAKVIRSRNIVNWILKTVENALSWERKIFSSAIWELSGILICREKYQTDCTAPPYPHLLSLLSPSFLQTSLQLDAANKSTPALTLSPILSQFIRLHSTHLPSSPSLFCTNWFCFDRPLFQPDSYLCSLSILLHFFPSSRLHFN